MLSNTRKPYSARSHAWLAGLAILIGMMIVYADAAYVVTWPATHVSGGWDVSLLVDDDFSNEVTTVQPVAWIVLGDVNRVTLRELETANETDLGFILTDRDNQTLLSVTHPQQVDLQNCSLTWRAYVWSSVDNITLRIVRGAEDTAFSLHVVAEKVTLGPFISYIYPLLPIAGGFILGFSLIGWGFYTLQYISRTAWD